VLVYAFTLGNLNFLAIDAFRVRLSLQGDVSRWLIFLVVELLLLPVIVTISTAMGFLLLGPTHMSGPFWQYLADGWKIPACMTLLFGIGYAFYRETEERLQCRNRDLQSAVEREVAGRELQAQDLERAREIQQALLPKEIAQVPGFEVVAAWLPARLVGGDYYDVIRLSDSTLGICIADVVGKGVSAALLMANVQATVRAYASEAASPSWLCTRVNEILCSNLADDKFVTLFYGVLDARHRILHYTNAGHLPPLLVRSSGAVERLSAGGAVLGVLPGWKFEEATVPLEPGVRLFLYTDGITEATGPDEEEFGEVGLLAAARSGSALVSSDLKTHLLAAINAFCNSQLQDDATLLLIAAQAQETKEHIEAKSSEILDHESASPGIAR